MIRRLKGTIVGKIRSQLIIDVAGIGYGVFVPSPTLANATTGTEAVLHISEAIREDAHDLYGFVSESERDGFETLRQVSGVGPKMALGLVSFYSADELAKHINSSNISALTLVPGVGKRLAEKIIVELKDKRTPLDLTGGAGDDLATALASLGYGRNEIATILAKVPAELKSDEARLTWALRQLAGKG